MFSGILEKIEELFSDEKEEVSQDPAQRGSEDNGNRDSLGDGDHNSLNDIKKFSQTEKRFFADLDERERKSSPPPASRPAHPIITPSSTDQMPPFGDHQTLSGEKIFRGKKLHVVPKAPTTTTTTTTTTTETNPFVNLVTNKPDQVNVSTNPFDFNYKEASQQIKQPHSSISTNPFDSDFQSTAKHPKALPQSNQSNYKSSSGSATLFPSPKKDLFDKYEYKEYAFIALTFGLYAYLRNCIREENLLAPIPIAKMAFALLLAPFAMGIGIATLFYPPDEFSNRLYNSEAEKPERKLKKN